MFGDCVGNGLGDGLVLREGVMPCDFISSVMAGFACRYPTSGRAATFMAVSALSAIMIAPLVRVAGVCAVAHAACKVVFASVNAVQSAVGNPQAASGGVPTTETKF